MNERKEARELIMRQIALFNNIVPDRLNHPTNDKLKAAYNTLAESILATIERKANVRW